MDYQFWKSITITGIIMGLFIWLYILSDSYMYAIATIFNSILVVAGFIFIALFIFLVIYAEPGKKTKSFNPWEEECKKARK